MLETQKQYKFIGRQLWLLQWILTRLINNRKPIIFGCVYVALSVFVMLHFLGSSLLGDRYYRSTYDAMMAGTAWKPFVYRVLIPKTTSTIVNATPIEWRKQINSRVSEFMRSPSTLEMRRLLPWTVQIYHRNESYSRLVTTLLIYFSLWGYIVMLHKLAATIVPEDDALKWFAPIFGIIAIPSFSWPLQFIYDIPVLFLSTACYLYLYTKSFRLYLFFFTLACLNRETVIFIFLFFTIWSYKRIGTSAFVVLWVMQCAIYASIKIVLTLTFLDNPGWFLENNLFKVVNQDLLSQGNISRILSIIILFFLFTYRWDAKPAFFKSALWVLAVMYGAYIVHGNPKEYRAFFDLFPILSLLITHTLTQAAGFPRLPFFQPNKANETSA